MFLLRSLAMSKPVLVPLKKKSVHVPKAMDVKSKPHKSKPMKSSRSGPRLGPISHSVPLRGNAFHSLWERRRRKINGDEKSKGLRLRDEIPTQVSDADAISSMSDGISPWTTYNVTLKGFSTLTVSGAGVLAVAIPADPSSAGYNFAEYTDLSAIFTEVRILALSIQLAPIIDNATALTAGTPVLVGFNPNVSSAPASEGAVASLIDSTYWTAGADRSTRGSIFHVNYDSRLDFSLTSSVTVTPYAGCPGSYQLYGSGYPNSSVLGKALVLGLYQFRGRS
jgi:hypothetical protein